MKRGTPDHPKAHTLAALLDVAQWGVVGILESLWHFTAKYAPAGDVGRFPDAAIARAIGWRGDAATLVVSLVEAGWIDRCSCHRLRVHDWPEHCDQYVKRSISSKFITCYQQGTVQAACKRDANGLHVDPAVPCRAVPCLAVPVPVPCRAVAESAAATDEPLTDQRPDVVVENSIRKAVWDDQRELLAAVGRIAASTGRDPPEVMREVTAYKRPDGTLVGGKINPASLSPERLEKSLGDARAWLVDLGVT